MILRHMRCAEHEPAPTLGFGLQLNADKLFCIALNLMKTRGIDGRAVTSGQCLLRSQPVSPRNNKPLQAVPVGRSRSGFGTGLRHYTAGPGLQCRRRSHHELPLVVVLSYHDRKAT